MNGAKIFLEIAKKDLKAANCLYKHKLYPQAVFYLQQSIEKTYKSFGILQGMTLDELKKKVGHFAFKILSINMKKTLKKMKKWHTSKQSSTNVSLIEKANKEYPLKVEKVAQLFGNRKLIESIPKAELISSLPDLVSKRKRMKILAVNPDDAFMQLERILKLTIGEKEYDVLKLQNKDFNFHLKHLALEIIDIGFLLCFLSLVIPSTCAENTRYPSKNKNPIKEYSRRNTIVKSFQELTKLCKTVYRKLSSFCADNETEEMNEV